MMRTASTTTMVAKLEADTVHVEHVQDFWGDPLTEAGAQSNDGKAAYVQVYLAGNQGEALANESVEAVQATRRRPPPPAGVKVFVTGRRRWRPISRSPATAACKIIEFATFGVIILMLLLVYRSIVTVVIVLAMVVPRAFRGPRCGGLPRLPRPDRALDVRDQPSGDAGDRRLDRLRDLPRRAISGGPHDRRGPGVGLLHDVPRHRPRGAGAPA